MPTVSPVEVPGTPGRRQPKKPWSTASAPAPVGSRCVQLRRQVLHVRRDRPRAHGEPIADLLVVETTGDQCQHVELARR